MHLLRFDSDAAWAANVCALWRDRLRATPALRMCLPSGVTPAALYAEMARGVRAGLASFGQATVFALDEFGGMDPGDPGLTRHTLRRQLIDAVDMTPERFHWLDPDAPDLAAHCAEYEAAIGGGFDLMLLGIGLNGHLGMNEPGAAPDSTTRRVDLHPSTIHGAARYFAHGRLPTWGVTVGLAAVPAAKEVWLLATGRAKAAIIERTVRGEVDLNVPSSLLRRHPNCYVFVDADAGTLLDAAPR